MTTVLVVGAVLMASLMTTVPDAAAAASTFRYDVFAQGADVIFSPNCPFDLVQPAGTVCDVYTVLYAREATAVGGAESSAPFLAKIYHETDVQLNPDGSGPTIAFELGTAPVAGSYDVSHLTRAQMAAVDIPMSSINLASEALTPNGRTVHLGPFTWTAASGTYLYGNNGPALGDGQRHLATHCETTNNLVHQKFTVGYVTGSLDGASIATDHQEEQIPGQQPADGTGYIFNNWFHYNDVTHC
jgi:hypothetical protein